MTVIRPNSVAGINSITVQSGNSLAVHKANGELIRTITSNSGVSTFSSISVGTATTDNSAAKSINIGLGASISQHNDNSLSFGTNGDERFQVNDNGKILIATTTTSEAHANQDELIIGSTSDDANHGITIVTPNDRYGTVAYSDGSGGTSQGLLEYNHSSDFFRIYTAASEALRIDSSGRLLIGTTTEGNTSGDDLTIQANDGGACGITLRSDTDEGGRIFFSDGTSGADEYRGVVGYSHGTNHMYFSTDATERLRIDSSGRLLYGVTSSTRETSLILQGNSNSYTTNPGVLELRVGQVPSSQASLGSLVFGCTGDKIGGTINAIADNADWSSGSSHPTALRFYTTAASSTTQVERLRITSAGNVQIPADTVKLQIGASQDLYLWHNGSTGNSNISNVTGDLFIQGNNGSGTAVNQIAVKSNAAVELNYQGTKKLETSSSGVTVTGTVTDNKGDVRNLILNAQSGDYTLVATDAGKFIRRTGGNITIPDDIFSTGNMVTILNDSGSSMTITAGSGFSLLNTSDAASGNRTLAGRGMATILFNSTEQGYISGAGLS